MLFSMLLCKYGRGQVAKSGMPALAVVKYFDVLAYRRLGLRTRRIAPVMDEFILQAPPEALDGGVVVTVALPRHGGHQTVPL